MRPGMKRCGFETEDRSRDWYCPSCKERNFMKRSACFKCLTPKPKDADLSAPPKATGPKSGDTIDGMVKSYNRKGFGFIMSLGDDQLQDIYYTRESLAQCLQTRDIPGQHVTFEVVRFSDGKITAKNIRPLGEPWPPPVAPPPPAAVGQKAGGFHGGFGKGGRDEEDRSRDWTCNICKERNFVRRFECFKCKTPRGKAGGFDAPPVSAPAKRTFSPHAGSRAVREALAANRGINGAGRRSRSRSRRSRSGSGSRSGSASSASSSRSKKKSNKDKKKKKHKKKKKKSSSSSSSSSSSEQGAEKDARQGVSTEGAEASTASERKDPEVEKAKQEALEQMLKLRDVEPRETRMSQYRALLRQWHPDKNPERTEMATAVFQFLQKGKPMLET